MPQVVEGPVHKSAGGGVGEVGEVAVVDVGEELAFAEEQGESGVVGAVVGEAVPALVNKGAGVGLAVSEPEVNQARDPGGGRKEEEDGQEDFERGSAFCGSVAGRIVSMG